MISSLMIVTSLAMFAFPKQLRGNRIPAPHQIESIDAHKTAPKLEQPEGELKPQLKGTHFSTTFFFFYFFDRCRVIYTFFFSITKFHRFPKDD